MNKNLFAALLGLLLLSPVLARAEGLYVKVGASHTRADVDSLGEGTTTGAALAIGMPLDETFDAELGYLYFGSSDPVTVIGGERTESSVKSQGFYLAGLAKLPLSESFSVYGKLGAVYAKTDWSGRDIDIASGVTTATFDGSQKRFAPLAGIGVSYRFSEQISAMIDYTYVHDLVVEGEDHAKLDLITASLKYSF